MKLYQFFIKKSIFAKTFYENEHLFIKHVKLLVVFLEKWPKIEKFFYIENIKIEKKKEKKRKMPLFENASKTYNKKAYFYYWNILFFDRWEGE